MSSYPAGVGFILTRMEATGDWLINIGCRGCWGDGSEDKVLVAQVCKYWLGAAAHLQFQEETEEPRASWRAGLATQVSSGFD